VKYAKVILTVPLEQEDFVIEAALQSFLQGLIVMKEIEKYHSL